MRKFLTAIAAVLVSAGIAWGASLSLLTGPQPAADLTSILNGIIQSINTGVTPASMGSWQTPRNYVDNGDFLVQQRGTGTVTCAANSAATNAAYGPDRWLCDANVGSGAGRMAVVTSSPTPPAGFASSVKLWRNSGALTQPVCAWQAIPTAEAVALQGQNVTLSAYMQALAGLSADNGNAATLIILTGTGSDEKFYGTSWTASPAITPAWTGIATTLSSAVTLTTSWARYEASVLIPTTANEIAVGLCFTPTATGAGATDGFAFTGVQLENGTAAGPYEHRKLSDETLRAYRFYYRLSEPASTAAVNGICQATGANTNACTVNLPVVMKATTPTITITTAGTFKVDIAGTPTTIATPTASVCSSGACAVTAANTNTAGQVELLTGGGGSGVWEINGDW